MYKHLFKDNIYSNLDIDSDDSKSDDNINEIIKKDEDQSIVSNSENTSLKIYMEPSILENINLEKYFSKDDINKATLNNKKLKITDKGLYSISKHNDAEWITNILLTFLKNNNANNDTIIDATAGIGGNTINFSKYFKKVYAIEINNTHYEVLKNNLESLSINNVICYYNNFLNIINDINSFNINSNIFFFDPPWGGTCYKNFKFFNLKIGKYPIYNIINLLFDKKFKYVILKAPFNLNLSPIHNNMKYSNMNIYSNSKKNMILCIFY
jgi:16S rRNA G966 N2-methylase RsmD